MKQIFCMTWAILISSTYHPEGTLPGAGETNELRRLSTIPGCWARKGIVSAADIENRSNTQIYFTFCCNCLVAQSCSTLCNPMDYKPPGSSVHGILQARILEWVAISFSRGFIQTQGSNLSLPHCRQIFFTVWSPREVPSLPFCCWIIFHYMDIGPWFNFKNIWKWLLWAGLPWCL